MEKLAKDLSISVTAVFAGNAEKPKGSGTPKGAPGFQVNWGTELAPRIYTYPVPTEVFGGPHFPVQLRFTLDAAKGTEVAGYTSKADARIKHQGVKQLR